MKKTYKIYNLDCPSCAALLESDLEDHGVKCKCSYQKSSLEIEFIPDLKESEIFSLVEKLGYRITHE